MGCNCQKQISGKCAKGAGCSNETSNVADGLLFVHAFGRVRKKCQQLDQLYQFAGKEPVFEQQFRKTLCPLWPAKRNLQTTEEIESFILDPALIAAGIAKEH